MEIEKTYKGREHSLIKHALLKGYLEMLMSIVAVSGVREFTYVDCFAGPWGSEDDSLDGTSIAISLVILSKVRETMEKRFGINSLKFQAIYVEENKRRYQRLSKYLDDNSPEGVKTHALHGDYWDRQADILQLCGKTSFAFFFVDPKGWRDVGVPKLKKLLRRPRSEFLITFMYDFLNRFIKVTELRQQVSEMLGNLTEHDIRMIESLNPKDREKFVVRKYREELKAALGRDGNFAPRSYHAEVLHNEKNRTLYHLVYLTRHPKGIVKFAEASEKVALLQRVVRIQKKHDSNPQLGFFSAEQEAEHQNGMRADIEDVKSYWLKILTGQPERFGESALADMLEDTGWLISDFEVAFFELMRKNQVENIDATGNRTKHPVHFDKRERLRRIS